MAITIDITNNLRFHLEEYCKRKSIKYSLGVKELSRAVGVNHRHIYAIANGNKRASSLLQFAICRFFQVQTEDIFTPIILNDYKQ